MTIGKEEQRNRGNTEGHERHEIETKSIDEGGRESNQSPYPPPTHTHTLYVSSPHPPRARVPIVKCIDDTSGIAVDICINNVLGVYNSRLLFTYATFDTRIHALVRQ